MLTNISNFIIRPAAENDVGTIFSLIKELADYEWSVLDWNTPAIRTYDKLNAKPMQDWTLYRLTGEALVELAKEE